MKPEPEPMAEVALPAVPSIFEEVPKELDAVSTGEPKDALHELKVGSTMPQFSLLHVVERWCQ